MLRDSTEQRRAIIVGSSGQDGSYLAERLRQENYELVLVERNRPDITDNQKVRQLVSRAEPHEIYLLAAYHHSAEGARESDEILFKRSLDIHAVSTSYFLEAIAVSAPTAKLLFASSSHIFPDSGPEALNENTRPRPGNVYAITKYSGMLACRYYREQRGVFASCGILFNHESSRRPAHFLSRKIAIAAAKISRNEADSLELGNLDATVDWGYAPDYVDAMYRIVQLDSPSDYIVATGMAHTVRRFADIAFRRAGLDYRDFVTEKPNLLTKKIETRIGDASRLKRDTGWKPSVSFEEMVEAMVDAELSGSPASAESPIRLDP